MTVDAWYLDDDMVTDQRKPHRQDPNAPAGESDLQEVGVLCWSFDTDTYKDDPEFAKVLSAKGYTYEDIITASPELPKFQEMMKSFYQEHMHVDDEARYILDGTAYFDIRDKHDKWIRIAVGKGDFVVIPGGMYHRFTLDETNYIKAMRLNMSEPLWVALYRPQDSHPVRNAYVQGMQA